MPVALCAVFMLGYFLYIGDLYLGCFPILGRLIPYFAISPAKLYKKSHICKHMGDKFDFSSIFNSEHDYFPVL